MGRRTSLAAGLVALLALAVPGVATATPILATAPNPLVIGAGDVGSDVTVDVTITGAVNLYGYQFSVDYDPAFVSVDSVNEGTFFSTAYPDPGQRSFFSGFDDTLGHLTFIANSLVGPVPGVSGNGTLASIAFMAIQAGSTTVTAFFDPDPFIGDGLITSDAPAAVPEPATMLLVATGSAFVMRRRARRRRDV